MKHSSKHIPFPTVFMVQYFVFVALCLFSIPILNIFSGVSAIIALSVVSSLALGVAIWAILLFTIGRNAPLTFNEEGIEIKMGKSKGRYLWKDAVFVECRQRIRVRFGYLLNYIVIHYSGGNAIAFEFNSRLIKDIRRLCEDEQFILKLNEAIKK